MEKRCWARRRAPPVSGVVAAAPPAPAGRGWLWPPPALPSPLSSLNLWAVRRPAAAPQAASRAATASGPHPSRRAATVGSGTSPAAPASHAAHVGSCGMGPRVRKRRATLGALSRESHDLAEVCVGGGGGGVVSAFPPLPLLPPSLRPLTSANGPSAPLAAPAPLDPTADWRRGTAPAAIGRGSAARARRRRPRAARAHSAPPRWPRRQRAMPPGSQPQTGCRPAGLHPPGWRGGSVMTTLGAMTRCRAGRRGGRWPGTTGRPGRRGRPSGMDQGGGAVGSWGSGAGGKHGAGWQGAPRPAKQCVAATVAATLFVAPISPPPPSICARQADA